MSRRCEKSGSAASAAAKGPAHHNGQRKGHCREMGMKRMGKCLESIVENRAPPLAYFEKSSRDARTDL